MGLFVKKDFVSHAGIPLKYKIECDALDDEDIETLAWLISTKVPSFSRVIGIPTGGLRIAAALRQYADPTADKILVVDDVWTTGTSMREFAKLENCIRVVIFARGNVDEGVTTLFKME